jgi:hypothetical protein
LAPNRIPVPEIASQTIVLRGAFNPSIFQPAWFSGQGILPAPEADDATIQVITPDVTIFSTALFELQATRDQFLVSTTRAPSPRMLCDLVLGTFQRLSHTPVSQLGINTDSHFRMPSREEWDELGVKLVPREHWTFLKQPGMRILQIQALRKDERAGAVNVRVEPSIRIMPGVYVQVNDHYMLSESPSPKGCADAMTVLTEQWDDSIEQSSDIIEGVFAS